MRIPKRKTAADDIRGGFISNIDGQFHYAVELNPDTISGRCFGCSLRDNTACSTHWSHLYPDLMCSIVTTHREVFHCLPRNASRLLESL